MPTECSAESFDFGTVKGRPVEAAFDGGLVTSDAGALLLGATDRSSMARQLAKRLRDAAGPRKSKHAPPRDACQLRPYGRRDAEEAAPVASRRERHGALALWHRIAEQGKSRRSKPGVLMVFECARDAAG
jgi:hypothetical protein